MLFNGCDVIEQALVLWEINSTIQMVYSLASTERGVYAARMRSNIYQREPFTKWSPADDGIDAVRCTTFTPLLAKGQRFC